MKKAIFTVITNNYDTLKEPKHLNPDWDFVCFTDNPTLKADRWRVVPLDNPQGLSPHLLSRRPKILVHDYLPDYDLTVYIDASYCVTGNLDDLIEVPKTGIGLVIRDLNRSIDDELKDLKKYKTIDKIPSLPYPTDEKGTYYFGGFIVRTKNDTIKQMMEKWWELLQIFHRDQPHLQYLLKMFHVTAHEYSTRMVRSIMSYHFHTNFTTTSDGDVYYFTPASPDKKIGRVYNNHCEAVPNNEDWICIRDGDTMFLTSNWSQIIQDVVKRYPDTALFGCYTNRIGLDYQLTEEGFSENPDVTYHAKIARDRWDKYGTECVEIQKPVAGMFMLFRRAVWTRVPFKDELVVGNKFFDWDFGDRVIKLGGTVRLIKGLYLMHGYRIWKDRRDKSHLL